MKKLKGVLCYIEGQKAYFTTQRLEDQWGDDWNDAPYEHNAGQPYEYHRERQDGKEPWEIHSVYFEGQFDTPDEWHRNSPYTVEAINNKMVPWLVGARYSHLDGKVKIWAGTPIEDFIRAVLESGGDVYLPIESLDLAKAG